MYEASFSDGYRQVAKAGLNNVARTWSVSWESVPAATAAALVAFFENLGGAPFTWTQPPPFDVDGDLAWYASSWDISYPAPTLLTVRADLIRYFLPA